MFHNFTPRKTFPIVKPYHSCNHYTLKFTGEVVNALIYIVIINSEIYSGGLYIISHHSDSLACHSLLKNQLSNCFNEG